MMAIRTRVVMEDTAANTAATTMRIIQGPRGGDMAMNTTLIDVDLGAEAGVAVGIGMTIGGQAAGRLDQQEEEGDTRNT
jgi:hypothetical protein